jgi:hypothetical protein
MKEEKMFVKKCKTCGNVFGYFGGRGRPPKNCPKCRRGPRYVGNNITIDGIQYQICKYNKSKREVYIPVDSKKSNSKKKDQEILIIGGIKHKIRRYKSGKVFYIPIE